jgi:hypothetical protein
MLAVRCLVGCAVLLGGTAVAVASPETNMRDATKGMEVATKSKVQRGMFNGKLCRDPEFCEGRLGKIQYQAHGMITSLLPHSQVPPETYLQACAGAFAGLSKASLNLASAAVARAFLDASEKTRASVTLGNVEMKVGPSMDMMACQFIRK